jgi:CxxC-x17-CxxC domain-containing protein
MGCTNALFLKLRQPLLLYSYTKDCIRYTMYGSSNYGGSKNFGGPRDSGPREMTKVICSDCGKECEVPFKPTEGRPVYCRDCLPKHRKPRY